MRWLVLLALAGCEMPLVGLGGGCSCERTVVVRHAAIAEAHHVVVQAGQERYEAICPGVGHLMACTADTITVSDLSAHVVSVSIGGREPVAVRLEAAPLRISECSACTEMTGEMP